uniref:L-seryl-tRNA(Sec) kinase n=1 Tax=Panagrolaimus davidi TaxID=227884 RepID=A0A914QGR9_9BILA
MPLLLLCGIPGAGKSTLAKQICKNFGAKDFSFDEFIEAQIEPSTSNRFNKDFDTFESVNDDADLLKPMKEYRKLWEKLIETYMNELLKWSDCNNPLIILDDNFYLQSQRRDFIKLGKRYGLKTCSIKVVEDVEEAQRRNDERKCINGGGGIPKALVINGNIIKKMNEKFEDSGINYFYDSTNSTIIDLFTFIQSFQKTYPDKFSFQNDHTISPSPPPIEQSVFQEFDTLSRKIANKIICSGLQRYGKEINEIRRKFMEQIKMNELEWKLKMDTVDCEENNIFIEKFLLDKIRELELEK